MCSARSCARPPAVATACAGRRRARLALAGLLLCVANGAEGKAIRSPRAAFETGEPALLSADTTKDWLGWQGAAALGFFAPNQQGMGLKALAKEYKGKLPIGGVRPTDTAVQQAFGVKPTDLPVILVTGHGDVPMAVDAMKEGAVDFIQKPYREEALLEKIEAALEQDQEQRKSLDEKQEIIRRVKSLTPREREIMDRMIAGQANKVIAIELEISQRTVEIHRSRVMHKMGTHSLAHLVRMVLSVKDLID